MSTSFQFVKLSDTIGATNFTSDKFDASSYSKVRIDAHLLAISANSIKVKVYVAAKADGNFTLLKETGAISSVGHTTLLLNSDTTAAEVLGWVRIVVDVETDSATGVSAIVDALFM